MGRYFSRAAVALPLLLAASNISAEEDVFKDAPGFYVELTGPKGETAKEVRTVKATPTAASASSSASAGTYGPLKSSDTMWSIASKVRPNRNVSVHQMMAAIFNKNPHAFLNNDINRLVNGAVLTIPSYEEISGVDKQVARESFIAKTQAAKPATKPVAKAAEPAKAEKVAEQVVTEKVKPTPAPAASPEPVQKVAETKVEQTMPDMAANNAAVSGELEQLKTQLDDSNEQLMQVAESNQRMKVKLEALSNDLSTLKTQLQEDSKVQLEIKELLSQQLAKPAPETTAQEESDDLLKIITSSWLYLGALIAMPILILLVILSFWLRAKTKREAEEQEQEIATSTSTLMEEKSEYDELLAADEEAQEASASEQEFTVEDNLAADELTNANLASDDIDLMSEIDLDSDDSLNADLDFGNDELESINDEFDSLKEMSEPESKAEPEDSFDFDLSDGLNLEDELIEPEVEQTNSIEELATEAPVIEDEVVFEQPIEEPVTADTVAEAEEIAFNPDELLSVDDLENIEFEEAEDELFELAESNELVQEEDMIVELGEDDDILLEELSPSAMDDDLVSDLAPKAEAATEVEAPKSATDLDEFDFNMAEDTPSEAIEESVAEPLEIETAEKSSGDDNELDWDFAEIDTVDEPVTAPEITEVDDIDDTDLLASQLGEIAFNEPSSPADVPNVADVSDDYIDIERLLEESGDESTDEPYQGANFDLGLDDFPEVLPEAGGVDVDIDEGGIGQKLDLARAYLEIDDKDGAKSILEEIQGQGSEEQIAEVTKLLNRLG
ncbi:FimV/HubP family polar landmark protein [Motilimonas sp. 1_MG-2023]|uniref:FimV/HubP family polar landmark protein n=1 Tax=Motilimonas sp. 1_MG-2023 TaxID=3062672 RepID=UPI0026E3C875|nr:FimV/HubP family polar landmark protein [Motilimonas sp. 1_MG-2023]MDO6526798.1 FimV/HubP family polar landmark protein [Motilimonas sp. 1_MG-2023]